MRAISSFVQSILGGIAIGIGGTVFLSMDNRVLGALLFSVGLFTICTFGFNLFTGKVCYIFDNKPSYTLFNVTVWIGNFVGTGIVALVLKATRISGIAETAQTISQVKLDDSLLSVFILAIFCNLLIYIAADGFKNNPHDFGKYLGIILGIMVFILCGFEHCIADMFYFTMAGVWSGKAVLYIVVITLGNVAGGVLIPLCKKLKEYAEKIDSIHTDSTSKTPVSSAK